MKRARDEISSTKSSSGIEEIPPKDTKMGKKDAEGIVKASSSSR